MDRFNVRNVVKKAIEEIENPSRIKKRNDRQSTWDRIVSGIGFFFHFDQKDVKRFNDYIKLKEEAKYYDDEYLEYLILELTNEIDSSRSYITVYLPAYFSILFFVSQIKGLSIFKVSAIVLCALYVPIYFFTRHGIKKSEQRLLAYRSEYSGRDTRK
ncbi:hypothetical protein [Fructobacillus parabroussonetiae]|uniref:Uncharacterized protein n=1 Tax=Fructobacillus parabroussonetiae TaxID=2713174 RepID=A0ABS5QWL7_9LACO|nr:hypothetical protein [Fructobacillus parabroussonetiae]MBS9337327.1 hypothetical protein [Fructobacillus parabroussonetiae]